MNKKYIHFYQFSHLRITISAQSLAEAKALYEKGEYEEAKPAFKKVKKRMDYTEEGGAPLLGVKGAVIKAHGSSNATAIKNALFQAARMVDGKVVDIIAEQISKLDIKPKTQEG